MGTAVPSVGERRVGSFAGGRKVALGRRSRPTAFIHAAVLLLEAKRRSRSWCARSLRDRDPARPSHTQSAVCALTECVFQHALCLPADLGRPRPAPVQCPVICHRRFLIETLNP